MVASQNVLEMVEVLGFLNLFSCIIKGRGVDLKLNIINCKSNIFRKRPSKTSTSFRSFRFSSILHWYLYQSNSNSAIIVLVHPNSIFNTSIHTSFPVASVLFNHLKSPTNISSSTHQ